MSNRNSDKVAAIRQAWRELPTELPDLDLYAQVAINVLTDWDKRSVRGWGGDGVKYIGGGGGGGGAG